MKRKLSTHDFNGKVVSFIKNKLRAHPSYIRENPKLGISFTIVSDNVGNNPDKYVHVKWMDEDGKMINFNRFPAECLRRRKITVPKLLKDNTLQELRQYLKTGYLDNLTYIEALANLKKIKAR